MYVLKLFQAVLVPLSAVGAVAQNNGSYTLREVGARNTVVSRFTQISSLHVHY